LWREVKDLPKNGNGNVLNACRRDADLLGRHGVSVLAVFDHDKVRELLGLPPTACKEDVVTAIQSRCAGTVSIVLLEENVETVISAIGACCEGVSDRLDRAIQDKDLNERDALLHVAAAAVPEVRECILERVPSLRRLVAHVVGRFTS
jgi:hypothetical protein